MKAIILDKVQASQVRGRHGIYSALEPVETEGGMFILPVEVMDDPEHAEVFSDLNRCKYAEIKLVQADDTTLNEGSNEREKQVLSVMEISSVSISTERTMVTKPVYVKAVVSGKVSQK